ncbi:tyrosine-type recombinase/integrase [Endozoicomonas atrinae]|uniref:tyrosine-type recombinase/integrase n=1 Tax=Endozoicomonas atrinae TaxID=1333660 RepID=UPI000826BA77|nr:integrase family protein [Endozoicomonas atrinae]
MSSISDAAIAELETELSGTKIKRELTGKLDGKPGVLMAKVRANKTELYYKYYFDEKRQTILLGKYTHLRKSGFITLAQGYDKAMEYADIRSQGKDPKEVINKEKEKAESGLRRRKKQAQIQGYGTFKRLLDEYVNTLKEPGTKQVVSSFFNRIHKHAPELLTMQARDIEWMHLAPIFEQILSEDKGPTANNLLTYIKAAFNKMMSVTLESGMMLTADQEFRLIANPVQHIKQNQKYMNPGKDEWPEHELAAIWHNAIKVNGPITGRFIRFTIANAGQRIKQVLRVPWEHYQLEYENQYGNPYLEVHNMKKKRGGKPVPHIVPLNKLAMAELTELKDITGHCVYPFPGRVGSGVRTDTYMDHSRMNRPMQVLCERIGIQKRTLGETRTTIKTMLGVYEELDKHTKNLLHGHGSMDTSDINYDKFLYFQQKRKAMDLWNDGLERMLERYRGTVVR